MRLYFLFICIVFTCLIDGKAQQLDGEIFDKAPKLEDYNFVLGTQSIGAHYKFTKESYIVEQAKHTLGMGSNILKISLGKNYAKSYGMKPVSGVKSTLDLLKKKKDYQEVMDMDFKYIFAWVHTFTPAKWQDGLTSEEKLTLYREMYELTEYVLKTYNNSGKTFLFGNWEGDWLLHSGYDKKSIPSEERIQGMIDWFNIRQIAVEDAKKNTPHKNVEVWHYIELNLALKGMQGEKCIAQSVLPNINPDLVSYSSYEIIKQKETYEDLKKDVGAVMDYIESKLQTKEGIPFKRRVYIGEYGYQTNKKQDDNDQNFLTKRMMKVSLDLDLPFSLHWEMYNNEYTKAGVSKGMSMISEEGKKKPVYYLHQNYYSAMNDYLKVYKKEHKSYPGYDVFKKKAIQVLDNL
ncbi:hypothetical protein E9993_08750 [Labilibacter sediminis]|nr:hypothetical protein E9993_08750 [Labilibacter sediminis]